MTVMVVEVELPMRKVESLFTFALTGPLPIPSIGVGHFIVPFHDTVTPSI
jgi:hypothetical protein